MLDQGPQFQSIDFQSLQEAVGIKKISADVESQSSLGAAERYYVYLRILFERVLVEHPKFSIKLSYSWRSKHATTLQGLTAFL